MQETKIIDGVEIISHTSPFWCYVAFTLIFILLVFLYFLPSIIAFKRQHKSRFGILIINIFLGLTFLGWVISLAWSVSKKD